MNKLTVLLIAAVLFFLANAQVQAESNLKINEFLAHPSSENKEWVEFYNPETTDLANYYLDDDTDFNSDLGTSGKKVLTSINNSNPQLPFFETDSFLNNSSDYVVLFSSSGEIIDQYQYSDDPGTDISIGRSPDGNGSFAKLTSNTKSQNNSQILPNPTPTPTPTPKPTATPTPTPQTTTATKSPTPTPKATPTPSKSTKPSSTTSPDVLGEKDKEPSTPEATPQIEVSPTPQPQQSNSKTKIAALLTGSGAIIIGVSIAFFLWYRKTLEKT